MNDTVKKERKKALKIAILTACVMLVCIGLVWCYSQNITNKDRIISIFYRHGSKFAEAVAVGDYSSVEKIRGVTSAGENWGRIEFRFGGAGLVSSSSYYGVCYIPGTVGGDYAEVFGSDSHWSVDGDGYRYIQGGKGDNEFYYEALGNGFYYYEEHF